MSRVECFSTEGLDPQRKMERWNHYATDCFNPLVSVPADAGAFSGSIARTSLSDITVAHVSSGAQVVHHSKAHVARTRRSMFFLELQLEGESINRQGGREAHLQPGDFLLLDSTRQYEISFPCASRALVFGVPDVHMRRHLAHAEGLVAIQMKAANGACSLLSQFLSHLWSECSHCIDEPRASRLGTAVLNLLAAAYADVQGTRAERTSLAQQHRVRILNYIEEHLCDEALSPTGIASTCNITARYLHHLFSDGDETVMRYILRRRLDLCARALASPLQRDRTITEIAFEHGFNSVTHFGRAFRDKYGVTPREYRCGS
jgi:AraC-like DNA-binding protein